MRVLGRKERYSETGPQNEKEQQLLLLHFPSTPVAVPLPLRWPDRRRRGWGMRSEVVGVQVLNYYR